MSPFSISFFNKSFAFFKKYPWIALGLILFLAALLRWMALMSLRGSIYFDVPLLDERLYHVWATKILNGTFTADTVYEFAPLPAYFLAFLYRIFSPDLFYFRLLNILMGIGTCYLIYSIGKQIGGVSTGLLAAFIAACYKPYIFYSVVPMKTMMSVFVATLVVYFLVACTQRDHWLKMILLGLFLGMLVNIRPNAVVLVPAIPVFLIWNHRRNGLGGSRLFRLALMFAAGIILALGPFTARNAKVAGEFAPVTSQSGFHLYMCNRLDRSTAIQFVSTSPYERGIQFTIEASRRVGKRLTPQEASAYWTKEALTGIAAHPLEFVRSVARKTLIALNGHEQGDHYQIDFLAQYLPFFRLPFFTFWAVIPFAMTAILFQFPKSRVFQALGMVLVVYGISLVIFFTNIRVRIPAVSFLIPCSAFCMLRFIDMFQRKKHRAWLAWFLAISVFFGVASIPFSKNQDWTAHYNTRAIILNAKGRTQEALALWKKSSEQSGHYSAYAQLALARFYFDRKAFETAHGYLEKISDQSFAAPQKYDLTGDFLLRQNRVNEAIRAFEKSLFLNGGQRSVRKKLIEILKKLGDHRRVEVESRKYQFISSFYHVF